MLRGVNLGGSTKLPSRPYVPTHHTGDERYEHRHVSFVDRPFPLSEADEHFARLREWGFNVVRLLTPWEAIEHEGPGIYDQEYIAYVIELIKVARAHDIKVFLDPHQGMRLG